MAAECQSRPDIVGRRQNGSWDGNVIPKAEQVETVRAEPEDGLGSVLEELANMSKTSNSKDMLSVKISTKLLPQFQLLVEWRDRGKELQTLRIRDF